jgi:predicted Zn-dependent peptidase
VNGIRFGIILLLSGLPLPAQDIRDLPSKVKDFTLPNGIRFVVAERHDIPTVAFRIRVGAGSANDPAGASGLAYIVERLAMKGGETIGSRDPAAERKALDALEEAQDKLDAERGKGPNANDTKIMSLQLEVQKAMGLAQNYVVSQEFRRALTDSGMKDWSSNVTADATEYHCVLPSNHAELWFLLESQWLQRPAFREFYQERTALAADEAAKAETTQAKALQTLGAAAFAAHPYKAPAHGWASDVAALRVNDARQFFNRYYAPGNVTIGIAGDIGQEEAHRLAERYFGPIPSRPVAPPAPTKEPPQIGPRTIILENSLQPMIAVGYKRPDQYDRDDATLDIIQLILAEGNGGWLQQDLVESKRLAMRISAQATFPGGRNPHLFVIMASLAPGHTADETEQALTATIARLQTNPVDDQTLARAKAMARANLVRRLADNTGIAGLLATFSSEYGDWRKLSSTMDSLQSVTPNQVQLAALKYLIPSRRTSVHMIPPVALPAPAAKAPPAKAPAVRRRPQ